MPLFMKLKVLERTLKTVKYCKGNNKYLARLTIEKEKESFMNIVIR